MDATFLEPGCPVTTSRFGKPLDQFRRLVGSDAMEPATRWDQMGPPCQVLDGPSRFMLFDPGLFGFEEMIESALRNPLAEEKKREGAPSFPVFPVSKSSLGFQRSSEGSKRPAPPETYLAGALGISLSHFDLLERARFG